MNGLNSNGNGGKNIYESPCMKWDRVPTHIPHVFIEHIKLNDRSVLILNDELAGFDMDTYSDNIRYKIIEQVFPMVRQRGNRSGGSIEIDEGELNRVNL
ncbi:MAG: hypothetical protein ABFD62_06530 [Syntrophaceae bacterium]